MRLLVFILLICTWSTELKAQVFPPDFQCVRNDTLFWEIPTNTCGTFNSYDIYVSTSVNGPFNLLSSQTNINATFFFHNNPTGETFYYYMESNYNCPGQTTLQSDTLNNESPTRSPITLVTVDNSIVEVSWTASNSPEVTSYIIYRTSPIGALPIDTVDVNLNNYIDFASNPDDQSESYFILAMDACGNTSVFDLPHFSIFINSTLDVCDQRIDLTWNKYRNWTNGIADQELWLDVNNTGFTLLETLSETDSTYAFDATNDGDTYCFYIKTKEANTGQESFSNVHCLSVDIVEPVRELYLQNASVTDDNEVVLTWQWNQDAEVAAVEFLERANGGNAATIASYTPGNSLGVVVNRTIDAADPTQAPRFYRVNTIDDCDTMQLSNEVATIHLTGIAQENQTNLINWTAFERADGTVDAYDIFRTVDGIRSYVATVDGTTTTFTDPVDISNAAEANVCYTIQANARVLSPDSTELSILSQSNTYCIEQLSDILVPNAFAPEGLNKEFMPRIVFGETVDYQMEIFDRWGKRIFVSTDQLIGWAGRDGFFYYPSAVYVYTIRIVQANGRTVEKRGNVVLIR